MDPEAAAVAAVIGGRIKRERQAHAWTLDRLAEVAGVSRRMVVHVEQGTVNPSVGTLLRLSGALGIGLPTLVDLPKQDEVEVTRSGHGATLWTSAAGGRGVLLAGTGGPQVLELWEWVLAAGDRKESEAHAVGTAELLHVHQGSVTIEVGGRTIALATGDAITFAGDGPHAYGNTGPEPARFSLAVFEPGGRS